MLRGAEGGWLGHRRGRGSPRAWLAQGVALALTLFFAVLFGKNPLSMKGWLAPLGLPSAALILLSLALGVGIAFGTIRTTRILLRRSKWMRALSDDLRPTVHGLSMTDIAITALVGGVAEELFFRGLLVPIFGIIAPAIVFGALHRVGGRARIAWALWATLMGLTLGAVFALTGSLVGPLVAHVAVNAANLRALRDGETPRASKRPLGGLLSRG